MNITRLLTVLTLMVPFGTGTLTSCSSSPTIDGGGPNDTTDGTDTDGKGGNKRDAGTDPDIIVPGPGGGRGDAGTLPPACRDNPDKCYVDYDAGPACGDGVVDDGEDCDDGNSLAGDGCNGACKVEPFYDCGDGTKCVFTIVCGDGALDRGEVCDDGNTKDGDGCSADCTQQDASYICVPGQACQRLYECGDSRVNGSDECDDGNTKNGDGCDSNCKLEEGYRCPSPGKPCVERPACGNKKRETGEQCDDGNTAGGDGCSETCRIEKDWTCNAQGDCSYTVVCGDGKVSGGELCDDGNTVSGDGCSDECTVIDEGYVCERPGFACRTVCGDGVIAGREQCDDGNTDANDGCNERCRLEANTVCTGEPSVCRDTVCGDGIVEGTEPCDNGTNAWGSGCTPECQIEPTCAVGSACASECGDGIKFPNEDCDDGNVVDGDGCSSDCKIELGFTCEEAEAGETLIMPMTVRDFVGAGANLVDGITQRNMDFEWQPVNTWSSRFGLTTGLVQQTLGANKKPLFAYDGDATSANNMGNCAQDYDVQVRDNIHYCANFVQNAASFNRWYNDVDAYNNTYQRELTLRRSGNTFVYDSDTHRPDGTAYGTARNGFWPLEDVVPNSAKTAQCSNGPQRNFHFTSEVRHWFQYDDSVEATLTFTGDDDVFVFIAGKLVIDIGGIHGKLQGSVTLTSDGNAVERRGTNNAQVGTIELNLEPGKIYEIIVFQAERNTCESNYRLELDNFTLAKSVCTPRCGDGIVTADEECDDGEDNTTTPQYDRCTTSCELGPFCGDGVKSGDEACDNGVNISGWGDTDPNACAPGCNPVPTCGDGQVDPGFEECDNGVDNVLSGYGECTTECTVGAFCGDGVRDTDHGETCDDGVNDGQYGSCTPECAPGPRCGDGKVQTEWGEQCDGQANCSDTCRLGAQCGDGIVQSELGEECDDGDNTGGYGQCAPSCLLGPYCGDSVVQSQEQCDDGVNNGGYGECAPGCRLGDRCGDGIVQTEFGEECDDGNSRPNDGCSPTCRKERRGTVK